VGEKKHTTFRQPSFVEYFNTFEDEVLVDMAENHPETLKRMCSLISLDIQLEAERYKKYRKTEYSA
jgi:hypothetical protein|tara:strand:- start:273 stop:470 length:198 start_codon:yes stop_codon:yes gene_type:complete